MNNNHREYYTTTYYIPMSSWVSAVISTAFYVLQLQLSHSGLSKITAPTTLSRTATAMPLLLAQLLLTQLLLPQE